MSGQRKLDPQEEKAIRMHRGLSVSDDMELEWEGQDRPDVMAQLRALEERAFVESGRIDEMRREAGVTSATKDKIVSKLKDATTSSAEAEAVVSAEASAEKKQH